MRRDRRSFVQRGALLGGGRALLRVDTAAASVGQAATAAAPTNATLGAIHGLHTTHGNCGDRQLPEDVLQAILQASVRAANASNMQSCSIVVVRDPGLMKELSGYETLHAALQRRRQPPAGERDASRAALSPRQRGRGLYWLRPEREAHCDGDAIAAPAEAIRLHRDAARLVESLSLACEDLRVATPLSLKCRQRTPGRRLAIWPDVICDLAG